MGTALYALHRAFQAFASFIRWSAPIWPWVALMALSAVIYHWTPVVGPRASQARLSAELVAMKEDRDNYQQKEAAAVLSLNLCRDLRKSDAAAAALAISSQAEQCRADIAAARRSAVIIEKLIGVPEDEDPSDDAPRRLIDPDGLRDALKAGS